MPPAQERDDVPDSGKSEGVELPLEVGEVAHRVFTDRGTGGIPQGDRSSQPDERREPQQTHDKRALERAASGLGPPAECQVDGDGK